MSAYRPLFVEARQEDPGLLEERIAHRARRGDCALVSPIDFYEMVWRFAAKATLSGPFEFEFTLLTPCGPVRVYADPDCPVGEFHCTEDSR